jgi:ABC-type sugar transport system permease subunit
MAYSSINSKLQAEKKSWLPRIREIWKDFLRHKFVYLAGVVMPVIIFIVFVGYPVIDTIRLSFFSWDGIGFGKTWIGLKNYVDLVHDPRFYVALKNTGLWTILTLLVPVGFGFFLAVFLSSNKVYASGLIRSLIFLPTTMSLITIGIMFGLILNPIFGAANTILSNFGLGFLAHDWMGDPRINLYTLIFTYAWSYMGLPLTMFFAGIRQIPTELFDAAKLDGANSFQSLRYITIPMLRPVFTIVIVLAVVNSVKAFDLVFAMTRGGPAGATDVLGYFMYLQGFLSSQYGFAATVSVTILVISSVFVFIYLRTIAGESLHAES